MKEEGPDLDLELNAKLMSKVSKPTAYYNRRGKQLGAMTEAEAKESGWPTEKAKGSTFSYLQWTLYRDTMLDHGCDVSLLRPFEWELEGVTLAPRTAVPKPNDRTSDSLREDLKSQRKGEIIKKDERWKTYGFSELSFALRRGSTSMHIHMMSAVANCYRQMKCDTLRKMTLLSVRAELTQIYESGSIGHLLERRTVVSTLVMRCLSITQSQDMRYEGRLFLSRVAGNALADLPEYQEEDLRTELRNAQEQIEIYKDKIRQLQHQNPFEFEDAIAASMRKARVKEKTIRVKLAQRLNAALTNISRANIHAKRRAILEDAWSAWHDAPPEGFNLEFDPRREAQHQEDQDMFRSNPSWRVPLPQTYQRASSSHEEIVASSSGEEIVDASIGFDNDKAEDFVDEVSKVPVDWDIQEGFMSVDHQYGIEDDIPPEAPRVARRPPMDKKDVRDMGTEKEQTAPWRRGKHAFEDVDGRYYAEGKKRSGKSSTTKDRFQ